MFRETVLARALSIAFSAAALTAVMPQVVMAQSSATGTIFGRVDSPSGATVVLLNTETGAKRTVTVDASGNYRVTALPTGRYKVDLVRNGAVASSQEVDVLLGQGAEVTFVATTAATQTVKVTGTRKRIDVSNTNNGAVFTQKELAKLPVATNLTAVTLLAPNTVRADAAYGGASFGGGAASENAYYINGFPVTNPLSQLGGSELPFGGVSQVSVITGGFGAEFGRSIGGVLNVITKSGTNNWEFGGSMSINPKSLMARVDDIYYPVQGTEDTAATDGKIHFRRREREDETIQYGFFLGGPIIQDKLFMFVAADETVRRRAYSNSTASTTLARDGWNEQKDRTQRYLLKFDWNLNDNHRLEWTTISDLTKEKYKTFGLDPVTNRGNGINYSTYTDENPDTAGATSNFLKYTGNLTDKLTLTTLYGESRAPRKLVFEEYDVNSPLYQIASSVAARVPSLNAQGLYQNKQKFGALGNIQKPGRDGIKSFRLDLEYKLGDHTLRAGLDDNKLTSTNAGNFTVGGGAWVYGKVPAGRENTPATVSLGRTATVANFGGFGTQGYFVTERLFSSVTQASAAQSAQYIEDRWQITKNLLLIGGIRNDNYSNSNGDGIKFIDVKNATAPRFSASWDVYGDASLKVFGSAGRYYLQLPTQVAARAASRSTLTRQDFTYTGIDPATGAPTGLNPINQPASANNELGQAKDPRTVAAKDIKPNYQDEITLGFEKAYSPDLNFGVKATYRKLGAGIDDNCDTRPIQAYLDTNHIDGAFISCYIFNPGEDSTIFVADRVGNGGRYVTFTAAQLGYPKIERKYTAVDLFLEHPLRNNWYGKVNYTWSRSKGNIEGQTRSDTGQTDIAISAAFDYPEFSPNSNGLLPNDRTHSLKAYGFYELTPEWSLGANLLIQSGRPKVCLGTNLPVDTADHGPGYGAEYFHCNGVDLPRGTIGRLAYEKRLDLSLAYKPRQIKGLGFKVEVYNVANAQTATARQEQYDGGDGAVLPNYGENRTTMAPRSAKLSVEYTHKF
ncbi:MAG: hypothetical protein RL748_1908 [Pseudomonadota bacterium]